MPGTLDVSGVLGGVAGVVAEAGGPIGLAPEPIAGNPGVVCGVSCGPGGGVVVV